MPVGKRYKLRTSTIALDALSPERPILVTVPAQSILEVISVVHSEDPRQVDVVIDGQTLTMFSADIKARGEEIPER